MQGGGKDGSPGQRFQLLAAAPFEDLPHSEKREQSA
jgi:hypothetical protein